MKAACFFISSILVLALSPTVVSGAGGYVVSVQNIPRGPMVGGFMHQNLRELGENEHNDYTSVARKAVDTMSLNQKGSNQLPMEMISLLDLSTQVIQGMKYDMTLQVSKDNQVVTCHLLVTVLSPWIEGGQWSVNTMTTDDPCADVAPPLKRRRPRSSHLLGGLEQVDDAEDVLVKHAAQWAVDHISEMSNSYYREVLKSIGHVQKQVVNGVLYRMQLTLVPTMCLNRPDTNGKTLEDCPDSSNGAKAKSCQVTVVDMRGEMSLKDWNCGVMETVSLIGGDDHDLQPHQKPENLIGGDGHDLKPHGTANLIGGDGHDSMPHGKRTLIGGDGHDSMPHGKRTLIGGDGHDTMPHGTPNLIGGDDHDLQPHGKPKLIGGDDHDFQPHGTPNVIGGDDHDRQPHGTPNVIGGDSHDYKPHAKVETLIGGDGHDSMPHGTHNLIGGGKHDYLPHSKQSNLIGGDGHDYKPHAKVETLIGGGKHDYLPHSNKLIGGDGHDYASHGLMNILRTSGSGSPVHHMSILGGGDHDLLPHVQSKCQKYMAQFKTFKATYTKLYAGLKEELHRFHVFCENMEKVEEIRRMEQGSAQYGATKFADMTEEEFGKQYLGLRPETQTSELPQAKIPEGPIPESWDWRDHGAVTGVKNQGSCGSCWAFSTTGNIEGQYAIHHKKLYSLSEQELVDCDKVDEGCNGGLPSNAYQAIIKLGGIETEKDYAYTGENDKCTFKKSEVVVKLSGAVNISQNEDEIAAWLYHNGPISIGINAFAMQFYFGGIAHPWKIFCNPKSLDHGVLIVGYGKEGNEPYWIVKNSWGTGWGRDGYYYVYRGDGTCGLNTMCTSGTVQ